MIFPGTEALKKVVPYDEQGFGFDSTSTDKISNGVDTVGNSLAFYLATIEGKSRFGGQAPLQHLVAQGRAWVCKDFVWRIVGGDKEYLFTACGVDNFLCYKEVPYMERIEGTAEDCRPHALVLLRILFLDFYWKEVKEILLLRFDL